VNSLEFCNRYLPSVWTERDLQLLIQKRLRRYWLKAPDEVQVKTPASLRRIDIATWLSVYEVKKWLTREAFFTPWHKRNSIPTTVKKRFG
jgi:hypothetical protein